MATFKRAGQLIIIRKPPVKPIPAHKQISKHGTPCFPFTPR